jgi:hypothetical protein
MQEQLISFETAKLAKEKNFEIGVNQSYIIYKESYNYDDDPNHRESYKVNDVEINSHYHVNNYKGIDLSNELYEAYSAPTQSLLQKWLREIHNIYVDSYHDLTADGKNIQYYTSWGFLQQKDNNGNQNMNGWYDEYNDWKTYEEALEFGLQQALKLIKEI